MTDKEQQNDPDIQVLADCIEALNQSSSRSMLLANLEYLMDRFIVHPSSHLPEHLKPAISVEKQNS